MMIRKTTLSVLMIVLAAASQIAIACPSDQILQSAISNNRVALCMTPNQVKAAEPAGLTEPEVHRRLLPTGPGVVEWIYPNRPAGWPVVIRFNGNQVIGLADVLPAYYHNHPDVLKD